MVLLVSGLFRSAWRYGFDDAVRPHLSLYLEYLLADIGTPPEAEAVARLAPSRTSGAPGSSAAS